MLELDTVISLGTVDPVRPNKIKDDWAFTLDDLDEGNVDPILEAHLLSESYLRSDTSYNARPTVSALIDVSTGMVVNNDYHHLTNYFEVEWREYHRAGAPALYPVGLRDDIDALNVIIFNEVNNGVYKAGFA